MADNKLKQIDIKNHTPYLNDLITVNDLDFGYLLDEKLYEDIFVCYLRWNVPYCIKPLFISFHTINGYIKDYNGSKKPNINF